jgi:hypothetical protein
MPKISMFYGVLIRMFFFDTDWELAANGKKPFPIRGLDQ